MRVGHWVITHNPKPGPNRPNDYDVEHDSYDGINSLFFTAGSVDEALDYIEYLMEEGK